MNSKFNKIELNFKITFVLLTYFYANIFSPNKSYV